MIKVNEIYYLSDQFGCKFIKITKCNHKNSETGSPWVTFLKCHSLAHIINDFSTTGSFERRNTNLNSLANLVEKIICEQTQMKMHALEKLINKFEYRKESNRFIGCIKITDDIIHKISMGEEIKDVLYLEYRNKDIIPKSITEAEFRELKINIIFN